MKGSILFLTPYLLLDYVNAELLSVSLSWSSSCLTVGEFAVREIYSSWRAFCYWT